MANKDRTYSKEFKIRVAGEAIEQDKKNLDRLSEKYEVPVSSILRWALELEKEGEGAFASESEEESSAGDDSGSAADGEELEIEVSDDDLAASLRHGVMFDNLNTRRLIFWSLLGIVLIFLFIVALQEMYQYNRFTSADAAAGSTEFYQVNQQKREATETLNSFGVVDLENGIYRIPIDSAINEMAEGR